MESLNSVDGGGVLLNPNRKIMAADESFFFNNKRTISHPWVTKV